MRRCVESSRNRMGMPARPCTSNRYIKPLNAEDWARLMDNLKRGPTLAQRKALDDALKLAKSVKLVE